MIGDYPISSDRSEVNPYIVALFDEEDLKLSKRQIKDRNKLAWVVSEDDSTEEMGAVFESKSSIIKDRLQVIGFTYQRAKEDFIQSAQEDSNRFVSYLKDPRFSNREHVTRHLNALQQSEYNDYLNSLIYIFENKIKNKQIDAHFSYKHFSILKHLLDDSDVLFNFPSSDIRNIIRGLVEILPENVLIKYDITEHINSSYYDEEVPEEDVYEIYNDLISREELLYEDRINEKIIILTEGMSDTNILQRSLELLYPHLSKYYSFMNFDQVPGGSGQLANYTKSFIGSGIKVRVISLFDNDTAGYSASKTLSKVEIPDNFRVLHLPDLQLALKYPTLGPTGLIWTNINQSACSIELYFGTDILMIDNELCPVQWTGFDRALNKYQGEIIDKRLIQENFYKKLSACENDNTLIDEYDWSGIKQILSLVFNAFNN